MAKNDWAPKRSRAIHEEEVSMFVAVLLEMNRAFKISEKRGSGILDDPYVRNIEYFATEVESKQIDTFMRKLRKVHSQNLQSLL